MLGLLGGPRITRGNEMGPSSPPMAVAGAGVGTSSSRWSNRGEEQVWSGRIVAGSSRSSSNGAAEQSREEIGAGEEEDDE